MNAFDIRCVDKTDNPVVVAESGGHWCRKISEGCLNCYAEAMNNRPAFPFASRLPYRGQPPALRLREEVLDSWRRARKPARRFVGSMTDLFGEWIPIEWHMKIFDAMAASPSQTFLLITKRPLVMKNAVQLWCRQNNRAELPPNIWCGVTTENQRRAVERIPILREIPARLRFLVAEPLLGEISHPLNGIDWMIIGGETGPRCRICEMRWILALIALCRKHGVPCFVKQLGSKPVIEGKSIRLRHPDGREPREWTGPLADLRVWEFPDVPVLGRGEGPGLFDLK
jgi:protein gp37